jgi:hypothetical protein
MALLDRGLARSPGPFGSVYRANARGQTVFAKLRLYLSPTEYGSPRQQPSGQAPAESNLERYFRVSPPAVHDMIKTLERRCIADTAGCSKPRYPDYGD